MARRSLLTPEMANDIVAILQLGLPIIEACETVGIDESTYHGWIRRGERAAKQKKPKPEERPYLQFFQSCKTARGRGKVALLNSLNRIALDDHHPKRAYALTWLLERMYPAQFGRRTIRFEMGEGTEALPAGPVIDVPGAGVPQATCNIIIEGGPVPEPGPIVDEPDEEGEEQA